MSDLCLVLNCGSSSIKFALVPRPAGADPAAWPVVDRQSVRASGQVSRIGQESASFRWHDQPARPLEVRGQAAYHDALAHILDEVDRRLAQEGAWRGAGGGMPRLAVVAHRVVHGGGHHHMPLKLDGASLAELKALIPLAPLHQPFALEAVELMLASHPGLPQVACFDTAFHHDLPMEERMLPLNWSAWQRGIRRYGFHGLSYDYIAQRLKGLAEPHAAGRVIVAHLGSGASLCAMREGRSVATTMGFSALDGLMMGSRCGSVDPGALLYLIEQEQLSVPELGRMLYHDSGLAGLSGRSGDMAELLVAEGGDERVQAALALYVRRIVRELGALVAVLGGLDLLVFTAGVGEHAAPIRARVAQALGFLGLQLDEGANTRHAEVISAPGSRVTVRVEPTCEEEVAARQAWGVVISA